jgi:hypothetical protein
VSPGLAALGVALLGLAAAFWPKLALPAAFLTFLGVLTLWPERAVPSGAASPPWYRRGASRRMLILIGALGSSAAVVRFVIVEAMPGIVRGGREAVQQRIVSRLRDVYFAQTTLQRAAWIDPDADGAGSAALLAELCGERPLRGQAERAEPVLDCGVLVATPAGAAAQSGPYSMVTCLPAAAGGWIAGLEGGAIDEDKAERHFFSFAWPAPASGFERWFFIDEREAILTGTLAHRGEPLDAHNPSCDVVWTATQSGTWAPWRGKKPRNLGKSRGGR